MPLVGCNPENADMIEDGYMKVLQILDSFVTRDQFLFVTHPSPNVYTCFYGITRPEVYELVHGKISRFSLDKLVLMLNRAGYEFEVNLTRVVEPDVPSARAILKDDSGLQIA